MNHTKTWTSLSLPSGPAAIIIASLALTGCAALQPEPVKMGELREALQTDRERHIKDIEPLTGVLTLEEAIARAIKYNADRRMRAMEQAVAEGTLDVGRYDMLPQLVASAGYRNRNNDLISRSEDSVTGAPSLANPYISSSRSATTTDLTFSWSLLDFGQSYFAAKQNADRVLIAQERKRKAVHLLVQDVRTAYWRVVASQSLGNNVRNAIKDAEAALQDANKAEKEALRNPIEPLRFQRQLLENIRLLEAVEQELSTANTELASLTSLPLGQKITVAAPAIEMQQAWLKMPIAQLEEQALMRNADLSEGFYNSRIAREETRRVLLKLFPGISFNFGPKHSDDDYLINQSWREAGLQLSFKLLGLLSAPAQLNLAEAGVALADQKRLVAQMAVLTQLHVARLQYTNNMRQFERADSITGVEQRLATHVANQVDAEKQTKLDRVSQQTSLILAQLRRFQALSNTQASASKLQATLGMEPMVEATSSDTLPELAKAIGQALKLWDSGILPQLPEDKKE